MKKYFLNQPVCAQASLYTHSSVSGDSTQAQTSVTNNSKYSNRGWHWHGTHHVLRAFARVCAQLLSHVWLFAIPWMDCSPQVPQSMWFSGKNTRMGCHFLIQGSSQSRDRTCVSPVAPDWQVGSLPRHYLGSLREFLHPSSILTIPGDSVVKNLLASVGD